MTPEERIILRDELFNILKLNNIIFTFDNSLLSVRRKKLKEFLKEHLDLQVKYDLYANQFRSEEETIYCLLHSDDPSKHICPICQNLCAFHIQKPRRYRQTCGSKKCAGILSATDEAKEKSIQTNLERRGVKYSFQDETVKDKIRKTMEKKHQTNCKNFGVNWSFESEDINAKSKATNQKKRMVNHSSNSKDVQNKISKSLKSRSINWDFFTDDEIEKILESIRFEVTDQDSKFTDNTHIKNLDIYSNDKRFKLLIERMYNQKNRSLRLNEITRIFNVVPEAIKNKLKDLNLLQYVLIQAYNLEVQFKELLDGNNIQYTQHDRNILYPQEIDFLIGDIGFVINEVHSHNIKKEDKRYHLDKTLLAKEKNVRLIHLWDWELRDEKLWERVSRWVLDVLNKNKVSVFARKCDIYNVSINKEKDFLNKYHLQGYQKSDVCYGLYYNNELVQLMSFSRQSGGKRFNSNYEWELLRLCTKHGVVIAGGANKLLKYFVKNCNPKSIISYCSLDKFDGLTYTNMGFKVLKSREPQLVWYNPETGRRFNHSSLVRLGADKLLKVNYGKGTNNEEIVRAHGYELVYNCGLSVYVMNHDEVNVE